MRTITNSHPIPYGLLKLKRIHFFAGGLFIAPSLGGRDPAYQLFGVNRLFVALLIVVTGSLLGEWLGIRQMLGRLWEWFGDQGWEYLDLDKAWQIGLAAGLAIWAVLLFRAVRPSFSHPDHGELSVLFFLSGLAIPSSMCPPSSIMARPISRSSILGATGSFICGCKTSSSSS
jgi:nitric oxide reductase large subunit